MAAEPVSKVWSCQTLHDGALQLELQGVDKSSYDALSKELEARHA